MWLKVRGEMWDTDRGNFCGFLMVEATFRGGSQGEVHPGVGRGPKQVYGCSAFRGKCKHVRVQAKRSGTNAGGLSALAACEPQELGHLDNDTSWLERVGFDSFIDR